MIGGGTSEVEPADGGNHVLHVQGSSRFGWMFDQENLVAPETAWSYSADMRQTYPDIALAVDSEYVHTHAPDQVAFALRDGQWHNVRMEMDHGGGAATVYLDGIDITPSDPSWTENLPRHHLSPSDYYIAFHFGNNGQSGDLYIDNVHFANIEDGEIHGRKWNDLDGDGEQDPNEPGLPGWTIYLDLNSNGQLDPDEPAATTRDDDPATPEDETGVYSFTDLPPGTYTVGEVMQEGWEQTFPQGNLALSSSIPSFPDKSASDTSVTLDSLVDVEKLILAGDPNGTPPDSPSQRVDPNTTDSDWAGVGSLDAGGTFLCSATAIGPQHILTAAHCLDIDDDGNSDFEPADVYFNLNYGGDLTHTIGAASLHIHPDFTGFGNPSINDDLAVIELQSALPNGAPVYDVRRSPLASGDALTTVGYGTTGDGVSGYQLGTASFTTKRFGQNNADLLGPDDEGGDAMEVIAWDFDGPQATCGAGPAGGPTLGNDIETQIGPGDSGGPNFVNEGGTWKLAAVNTFGGQFAGWPAPDGRFTSAGGGILVAPYADWIDSIVHPHSPPGTHTVTIGPGEVVSGVDFGNRLMDTAEIHGMKWNDVDGDGVFEPQDGETGLVGWTIYLDLDANGQLGPDEPSVMTRDDDPATPEDETGRYSFTGLTAGTYVVAEVPKPGWQQTYPLASGEYRATSLSFEFEDISATGDVGMAPYVDDGYFELTAADLAGFEFELYGSTYDHVFASSNGLITFGSGTSSFSNSDLTISPTQAAIAAFWDDLVVSTSESPDAAVLWEVRGSGDAQRLVLQWHEIRYFLGSGDGEITFQAILNESDGSVQFNYLDLETTGWRSEGASATVGIKDAGAQGDNRLLLSYNSGPDEYVDSGQSVRISSAVGPVPHVVTVGDSEVVDGINFGNQRDADLQIVSGPTSVSARAGQPFDIEIQYDTSTRDTTLTGLGVRVHYDSSFLVFDGLTDVLPTNFVAQQGPMDDVADFDNDPNTDMYVLVAWSDPLGGNWPNEALPVDLFDAHLHFVDGLQVDESTNINFSASSTAAGYEFDGRSITAIVASPVNLDVDDNCDADANTDGVLIFRYLFGFTGEDLVREALAPDARRTNPGEIVDFLDARRTTMLDPDDNGEANALTDGVLILRYLFGFRDEALVRDAVAPDAGRTDPVEIAEFLHGFVPSCSAEMQSPSVDVTMQLPASGLLPLTRLLLAGEGEALQNLQVVSPSPDSQVVQPGDQVSIDVSYTTTPEDPTLMGLGLRIHIDSSALSFEALSNVLGTNLVAQQAPQPDTLDYDNDPSTDQFVLVAWSDPFGGNWPGSLPATLYTATFTAAADFEGDTMVNFSASSTAAGFRLSATSAQIRIEETQAPSELLQIRLETTDPDGNPVSSVVVGDPFLLRGYVEDLRSNPFGVFATYLDVTYDPVSATVVGDIAYGPSFPNVHVGDTSSEGLIDEVGAVAEGNPLGGSEFLLFSVPLLATEVGQATFAAHPADLLPQHQSLLFGQDEPVLDSQIIYGTATIDVQTALVPNPDFASTDEDHTVDIAVLANDVGQNLSIIAVDTQSARGAIVTDNGDGTLRYDPQDAAALQSLAFGERHDDTFTYMIRDANGTTAAATVTVTVAGVNDAPTVENLLPDQRIMPTLPFSLTIPADTFADLENDTLSYDLSGLPGWLTPDSQTDTFSGTPRISDDGAYTIQVIAMDNGEPRLSATDVFSITVYNPYQNPDDACDVNDDDVVTALDVLIVINELNGNGARRLPIPPEPPLVPPPYPDVNGDLYVSPIDALRIINFLNASVAEGEASAHTINPLAADQLFSQESELGSQAGDIPIIPVTGKWNGSGDDEPWEPEPAGTISPSSGTGAERRTPLHFNASPSQADSASRPDEVWHSGSIETLGLGIASALNDLLPDIAEELAAH